MCRVFNRAFFAHSVVCGWGSHARYGVGFRQPLQSSRAELLCVRWGNYQQPSGAHSVPDTDASAATIASTTHATTDAAGVHGHAWMDQ